MKLVLKLTALIGIGLFFCGCAQQKFVYGIPGSVWQQLTPAEQDEIRIANPEKRKST